MQSTISQIALFVFFILALFLFTVPAKDKRSNRLFGLFLLISAIDISGWFTHIFVEDFPGLEMFRSKLSFLSSPVLFLYVLSVCYSDFKFQWKHLLHTIPFLLVNLILIPRFYSVGHEAKIAFFENYSSMPEIMGSHVLAHLQFYFYMAAIFMVLKKTKQVHVENYAAAGKYQWLFQFAVLSVAVHSLVVIKDIFKFTPYADVFSGLRLLLGLVLLVYLCWFVLKLLNNPGLFRGVDSELQPVKEMIAKTPAVEKNIPEESAKEIQQLKEYMEKEEPFLDPALSIQSLAASLKTSSRELSVLINHIVGKHFFDFVNEYRIEKAKEILSEPENHKMTVLEILYAVGFNSKSSFNTAFKKHTGQTPTQYRKGLKEKVLA